MVYPRINADIMKKYILIVLICFMAISVLAIPGQIKISGSLPIFQNSDSVRLEICKYGVRSFNTTALNQTYTTSIKGQAFIFKLKSTFVPQYINLTFLMRGSTRFINGNYFLEDGDDIKIDEINSINYVHFSGAGSNKLNIIYQLSQIDQYYLRQHPTIKASNDIATYLSNRDSSTFAQLRYLYENKHKISRAAYMIIRSNLLSANMGKYNSIVYYLNDQGNTNWHETYEQYKDNILKEFDLLKVSKNPYLSYSQSFAHAVIYKFRFDSCTVVNKPYEFINCYNYLKDSYSGVLRERILTNLIYDNRTVGDILIGIKDAQNFVINSDFKPVLLKLRNQRTQGVKAYEFMLPDTTGKIFTLSQFKGKVVVLDLWFSGCGACLASYPYFRKVEEKFSSDTSVVFVSICEDKEKKSWIRSLKSGKYSSNLALNLYTMGKGDKHDLIQHYDIEGYPTFIVIDKKGYLMNNPINPTEDNGKSLSNIINEGLISKDN